MEWLERSFLWALVAHIPLLVFIVVGVFGAPFVAEQSLTPKWLVGFFIAAMIHAGVITVLNFLVVRTWGD